MLTAILIDDMPQALAGLQQDLLTYCPQVTVIGTAGSVVAGAKLLRQVQPDILFLDIMLTDGTGFDLLEIITNPRFALIFTTASDEFAIRAFRYAAIDYLLKPIDTEELQAAVAKVSTRQVATPEQWSVLRDTYQRPAAPTRIALHTLDKIHVVDIDRILRCESDNNCTWFFFVDGTKLLVTKTLKMFEQLFAEQGFLRPHQSHLVNGQHIREFVKTEGGYLVLSDGAMVPVASRKRQEVMDWLS